MKILIPAAVAALLGVAAAGTLGAEDMLWPAASYFRQPAGGMLGDDRAGQPTENPLQQLQQPYEEFDPDTGNLFRSSPLQGNKITLTIADERAEELAQVRLDLADGEILYRLATSKMDPYVATYLEFNGSQFPRQLLGRFLQHRLQGRAVPLPFIAAAYRYDSAPLRHWDPAGCRGTCGGLSPKFGSVAALLKLMESRAGAASAGIYPVFSPRGVYGNWLNELAAQGRRQQWRGSIFRQRIREGLDFAAAASILERHGACLENDYPSYGRVHLGPLADPENAVPRFQRRAIRRLGDEFEYVWWAGAVPEACLEQGEKYRLPPGALVVVSLPRSEKISREVRQAQHQELFSQVVNLLKHGRLVAVQGKEPLLAYGLDPRGIWVWDPQDSPRRNQRGRLLSYKAAQRLFSSIAYLHGE